MITFMDVGERLVIVWCTSRDTCASHQPDFQAGTRKYTPAATIVKIVEFKNPEFQLLTSYQQWRRPLA
jgi:hypothetical protein